jgi:hypothetical protein
MLIAILLQFLHHFKAHMLPFRYFNNSYMRMCSILCHFALCYDLQECNRNINQGLGVVIRKK